MLTVIRHNLVEDRPVRTTSLEGEDDSEEETSSQPVEVDEPIEGEEP
jgi:hypothetical protein